MAGAPTFDQYKLINGAARFLEAAAILKLDSASDRILPILDRVRLGVFRLVVAGEIKKGKSSLINALLGHPELVPTGVDIKTSTVFKIIYGPQLRYLVFFQSAESEGQPAVQPQPREIDAKELALFGTEDGNPGNEKKVDYIGIEFPHALLKSGLAIIDLPGLGGLVREHSLLAMRYLPNADGVLFVVDSTEQLLGQSEIELLADLRARNPLILFAQTKSKVVGAQHAEAWRKRNLAILEEKLGLQADQTHYFVVDSKRKEIADEEKSLADIQESGFPLLLGFLNNVLIPRKQSALALPLARAIIAEVEDARRPIQEALKVASTSSKEELARLEADFQTRKSDFEAWKRKELPDILEKFRDAFDSAYRAAHDAVLVEIDYSLAGPLIAKRMSPFEGGNTFSAKAIADRAQAEVDGLIKDCDQRLTQIAADLERKVANAYLDAARKIGTAARPVSVQGSRPPPPTQHNAPPIRIDAGVFDLLRSGVYGGMLGATVLGWVASLAFPPAAVAATVATGIAFAGGALQSLYNTSTRQTQAALGQLRTVLADLVRRMQGSAQRYFMHSAEDTRRHMERALRDAIEQREKELQQALTDIQEQRRRNIGEVKAKQTELRSNLQLLDSVLQSLRAAQVVSRPAA